LIWILIAIIIGSVALDQLTKWLAVVFLQPEGAAGSFHLWENVLHLTYVKNEGAAFGMLADHRFVFLILSTIGILAILFYLFWDRELDLFSFVSLACVAGGGIGNMIDRVVLGYVIDFIDFTLIDFAVFNVADSFVCVGAGMMIVYLIADIVKDYKKAKTKDSGKNDAEQNNGTDVE
jgi:signal peptidase II